MKTRPLICAWLELALAGWLLPWVAFSAESGVIPPAAWQITDSSTLAGTGFNYSHNLDAAQQIAATNAGGGFRFAIRARLVTDFGGGKTMAMGYGLGSRRFFIYWDLNSAGDLTAELEGESTYTLTANSGGTALYHTHEIIYNPATGKASYVMDGEVKTANWPGSAIALPAGQVFWGAGSSPGRGQMNFYSVAFEVTNTVLASYGIDGVLDPDPQAQGWTPNPMFPPAGTEVILVPLDAALLPVVQTLPADQLMSASALLNGNIDPRGSPTKAWFEWGTDRNYGNVTPIQDLEPRQGGAKIHVTLGGLAGTEYHYRMVASNAFGVFPGTNEWFSLRFVLISSGEHSPSLDRVAAWGDYDNDGRLDRLVTGLTMAGPVSQIWRNTGSGFSNVTATVAPSLPGVADGSVAWGDYDNDGRLDFLLTGASGAGLVSQIWRNTGSEFSNVTATVAPSLPGVSNSSVAWGDYDNDGRLDFLLTGASGAGPVSQIWRNTGSGFGNVTASVAPDLPELSDGSVAWGDYDNDGRLDFLLTGGRSFQVWQNTGNTFTNVTDRGMPAFNDTSVAWGDYDNDGRLDFVITGRSVDSSGSASQIWRNTDSGFSNVTASVAPDLRGVSRGSVAWGDYDNDGRLDFLLGGTQLWRNNLPLTNAAPAAPTDLSAAFSGSNVTFHWFAPPDDRTPALGLSYNVRIGTTPGGSDIVSPMSVPEGLRLLPAMGNGQVGTGGLYRLFPGRTYYWSVQALDTSFAGSPFSAEQQFTIPPVLINPARFPNGVFEFHFTDQTGLNYEVLAATDAALPLTSWINLGPALLLGNDLYRFTDVGAMGQPRRFYLLRAQ